MEAESNDVTKNVENLIILNVLARQLDPSHRKLIINKWLTTLRHLNLEFKQMDSKSYYKHYESYIKGILARPTVQIRLLVLESDNDIVFGWSAFENDVLHYVHVQEPYRGQKYSYDLIPTNIVSFSHRTKYWNERLWKGKKTQKKLKHLIYNPFI